MNTLKMTVGLPRSGKSTWAKKQGCPVVNPDSIRLALHGEPFIGLAEPFVWAIAKTMVRSLFLAGHREVVLDATNTTRARRDEWKSVDWKREFYVFPLSAGEAEEIARATIIEEMHKENLVAAIHRMAENFEPVEADEWGGAGFVERVERQEEKWGRIATLSPRAEEI